MLFTDPTFLFVFLPLSCFLFYQVSSRFGQTAGLVIILLASVVFYLPWGSWMLAVLLVSISLNFIASQVLLGLPDRRRKARFAVFGGAELINLAILVWFKYPLPQAIAQRGFTAAAVIPVGISFYTFHQAAFLADTYRRDPSVVSYLGGVKSAAAALVGYIRYAAFIMFFPQLVVGPITYLKEFQPQVQNRRFGNLHHSDIAVGVALLVIGLFKKVVIADNLAVYVDPVFARANTGLPMHWTIAWIGMLGYYAQLYFDFSGYSDMALGIARMFGVRFPINFFSPLKAVGIVDYYRRWHMSLTRVIARFLYTPLSLAGTRFALSRQLSPWTTAVVGMWLPLLANFEVIGIWHGVRSTFVVFGLIHGLWYILETTVRTTSAWKQWRKSTTDRFRTVLGRVIFVVPMCLTCALFRSDSVGAAWRLMTQLVSTDPGDVPPWLPSLRPWALLVLSFAIIYLLPNSIELLRRWRPGLMTYSNPSYGFRQLMFRWRPTWAWTLFLAGLLVTSLFFINRQPPFLYMGF
jgi:alginate O-acetyltransferase complex protein AlgI